MSRQKASLGYLRNGREMNITNSWIFLALNILNLFSIDMLDKRRIYIYFIQEFVISMHQALKAPSGGIYHLIKKQHAKNRGIWCYSGLFATTLVLVVYFCNNIGTCCIHLQVTFVFLPKLQQHSTSILFEDNAARCGVRKMQ